MSLYSRHPHFILNLPNQNKNHFDIKNFQVQNHQYQKFEVVKIQNFKTKSKKRLLKYFQLVLKMLYQVVLIEQQP